MDESPWGFKSPLAHEALPVWAAACWGAILGRTRSSKWDQIELHLSSGTGVSELDVRGAMRLLPTAFRELLTNAGFESDAARKITTKFRDAGRRSAPWRVFSGRVAGRPQDGADGNRIKRWLLPADHKFYATERDATLVEIKYYFQALSMLDAPEIPGGDLQRSIVWLLGHEVKPGLYRDPITLNPISLIDFIENPRSVTSGHIHPLDRGGRHVPENTFLQLKQMNDLQGNNTIDELLVLMDGIVRRHKQQGSFPATSSAYQTVAAESSRRS